MEYKIVTTSRENVARGQSLALFPFLHSVYVAQLSLALASVYYGSVITGIGSIPMLRREGEKMANNNPDAAVSPVAKNRAGATLNFATLLLLLLLLRPHLCVPYLCIFRNPPPGWR